MDSTKHKKSYEVTREGFITVYPLLHVLHESKEKGKLRLILKRLIQEVNSVEKGALEAMVSIVRQSCVIEVILRYIHNEN
jgi:hypothetical protein